MNQVQIFALLAMSPVIIFLIVKFLIIFYNALHEIYEIFGAEKFFFGIISIFSFIIGAALWISQL